jgi:hypothetical protein
MIVPQSVVDRVSVLARLYRYGLREDRDCDYFVKVA